MKETKKSKNMLRFFILKRVGMNVGTKRGMNICSKVDHTKEYIESLSLPMKVTKGETNEDEGNRELSAWLSCFSQAHINKGKKKQEQGRLPRQDRRTQVHHQNKQ